MTSLQVLRALLEITVYSAVVFACIMVFKAITKGKLSPTLSFVLWFLLLVRLCVPVTIESAVHLFTLPQEQQAAAPYASASIPQQGLTSESALHPYVPAQQPAMQTQEIEPTANEPQNTLPAPTVYGWIMIAWLGGICVFGAWTTGLSMQIAKVIKYKSVPVPAEIERIYEACRREMGIKKRPPLLVTQDLFSPALVVSVRPTILLPCDFAAHAPGEQIRLALCHELTHYKRKDHWLCILLRVLSVVYWFNPVIWLAEKEIAADMETACDNRIVRGMQKEEKAYYANTILSMFSARTETPFVLGLALPNTKRVAEKRIRGIYMKSKTKKSVKFGAILLTLVLLVSCFTTACQPALAETLPSLAASGSTQTPASASAAPVVQQPQPFAAADNKYKETSKVSDLTSVNYNADVVQPGQVPEATMQIRDFTEADMQKVADYFFAGQPAYTPWPRTKADIQKEIEAYQQANIDMDTAREKYIAGHPWAAGLYQYMLDNDGGMTSDEWDKVAGQYSLTDADQEAFMYACGRIASIKQNIYEIQKDQEELRTAPDTAERKPAVIKFQDVNLGNVAGVESGVEQYTNNNLIMNQCKVWSEKPGGTISEVFGARLDNGQNSSIMYSREIHISQIPVEQAAYPPLTLPQEEAQKLAEQAVAAICPDLTLAGATIGQHVSAIGEESGTPGYYKFNFSRKVEGVPVTFDAHSTSYNYEVGDDLKAISYEDISVSVDNGGIQWLEWRTPYDNIQITSQNAKTLSMEEAKQKFEQNLLVQLEKANFNALAEESRFNVGSIILDVDKIQLGLTRIQEKDGSFRLIPTWDFFGKATAYNKDGKEVQGNRFGQSLGNESLGTVNALDGTDVDRIGPIMSHW